MNFIEGLPQSGNANSILVVVDKFSKFAHFIPMKHPFTTAVVAKLFMDTVFRLHGLPTAIISDRDRVFTRKFWQLLFRAAGTNLHLSSSYHLQTDGQTERVNHCLETYLRCFVDACPSQWSKWLSLAEFWYNSSSHSALGCSPFKVLYGHQPRHFGLDIDSLAPLPDMQTWIQNKKLCWNWLSNTCCACKLE
jgi:transposase InsO family protein